MDYAPSEIKDEINIESDCQTSGPGKEVCNICWKSFESVPKIRCAECSNIVLCLQCFSLGLETKTHHCSHSYHIDRRHIAIDPETTWTIYEDSELLSAVNECGYGNFEDIGKKFLHRTIDEIRIRINEVLELDKAPLLSPIQINQKPVVNYNPESLKEEPPRYPYRCHYAKGVAGYCASRGDFEVEPDNNAENMLCDLDSDSDAELNDEDSKLSDNITYSLVQCYNSKLIERQRYKNVVKEHGLLLKKTSFINMATLNPKMMVFTQLMDHDNFNSLIEGLKMEKEIKRKLNGLRRYRGLGITRLRACSIYNKLDAIRKSSENGRFCFTKIPSKKGTTVQVKKIPQPIDITNCTGFSHLSEKERTMCATLRVLPEIYLKFKMALLEIDAAEGGVRLMTARQLLKIDVNKTRKIYNFLRDEELIRSK